MLTIYLLNESQIQVFYLTSVIKILSFFISKKGFLLTCVKYKGKMMWDYTVENKNTSTPRKAKRRESISLVT